VVGLSPTEGFNQSTVGGNLASSPSLYLLSLPSSASSVPIFAPPHLMFILLCKFLSTVKMIKF